MIIKLLLFFTSALGALFGAFYAFIIIFGRFRRLKTFPAAVNVRKLAVIIPARDEARVIAGLIESLKAQKYPRDMYDIYVAPNNCTDDTERVAREAGALIIDIKGDVRGKGDVLRQAFDRLAHLGYDAYCIFDADNVADAGFLSAVNDTREAGYLIAQGRRDSKNPEASWVALCTSMFYWFMNGLYNRPRAALGMSAALNGTGFMVSAELIEKIGFNTSTLTEDLELTAQCALANVRIGWMDNAVTYDEQPLSMKVSFIQRRRWGAGTLQCFKLYSSKLLKNLFRTRNPLSLDMALLFSAPYLQAIMLIPMIIGAVEYIEMACGIPVEQIPLFAVLSFGAVALYLLGGGIGGLAICICEGKLTLKRFFPALMMGLFLFTWMPANLICLITRPPRWIKIEHGAHT